MRCFFIALLSSTWMIAAAHAAPSGHKVHAGNAITSPADLKRWDEQNLKRGEAVGKAAVSKSGKADRELSPADIKRQDEIKVKNVLAAQQKEKQRTAEMLAQAKKLTEAKPAPNYVLMALDAAVDQGNSYALGQVLEWTLGKTAGGAVGIAIDLLTPANSLDPVDPYDLPRNKEEMKALRKYLEEQEAIQKALKAPVPSPTPIPDATLDPKLDNFRNPASLAEVRLKRSVIAAITQRNGDAGYIVERVLASSMPANPDKLDDTVVTALRDGLVKLLPPNVCRISSSDVCTLNVGAQGDACMCPKLDLGGYDTRLWAKGIATRRPVSNMCSSPVGNCAMTATGPVGTPCYCVPTFPVPGPMPIGRIVPAQ